MSPNSSKLFTGAIMQSNVAGYPYKDREEGLKYGKLFMDKLKCKDLACMRAKNYTEVMDAQRQVEESTLDIIDIVLSWQRCDHALLCR